MKNIDLWDILRDHYGHRVEIAIYGDPNDPSSVTLEDMDTNSVILDAELYTLTERTEESIKNPGKDDLISRGELLQKITSYPGVMDKSTAKRMIIQQPCGERTGEWILDEERSADHIEKIFMCSACKNNEAWGYTECTPYCSHCGAKMLRVIWKEE